MFYTIECLLVALSLFLSMLFFEEVGRRIGKRQMAEDSNNIIEGTGVVDGAVFAVLGLLVAFTFTGAGSRFDTRRHLIADEANAISTAYLRLDLLPKQKPELQSLLREYLDSRLEFYKNFNRDWSILDALQIKTNALQRRIWNKAIEATQNENKSQATMLVLQSLNAMFDIVTTRTVAAQVHPPQIVYILLFILSLISSILVGFSMSKGKRRNWLHLVGFSMVMSLIIYSILDLEHPRQGLIRIDDMDSVLIQLRKQLGP